MTDAKREGTDAAAGMRRRRRALSVLGAAAAVAAIVLVVAARAVDPAAGPYLRYRMPEDPPNLDPIRANDENSLVYMVNLFDGLVEFEAGGLRVVPAVAESWTISSDGRTYTFRLRRGVRFHNGREVAADDVAWSLRRALDPRNTSPLRPFLERIEGAKAFGSGAAPDLGGVSAPDAGTVVVRLERPFGAFLSVLATPVGSILPREVYADPNEAYLRHPVGCGPFRFESWDQGVSIRLAAFREHWKGPPEIPGVQVRFIASATTAFEEYRTGGLEFDNEVPSGRREWARSNLPDDYRSWPRLATAYVAINHLAAPFKGNAALRRALNFAVDRERIATVLQQRKDRPTSRLLPPGMLGHNPAPGPFRFDRAESRRLLAEAGFPEGRGLPEITYLTQSNEAIRRYAEAVQADFAAIGLKVRLQTLDFGGYLRAIEGTPETGAQAALFQFIWFADYPDPDGFLRVILHSSNFGSAGNYGRYSNPEVDRLLDQGRDESDPATREAIYRKAEEIALQDGCAIPLYHFGEDALLRPEVEGLRTSPLGDFAIPLELLRFRR